MIGTVGTDNQGLTGLEASDNSILGAASGERAVTVDGLGKEIERNTVSQAQHGEDLRLTIDAQIQARTEQVLAGIGATYQPKGATAIVMNPRNSQILAMANWPTVDPSDPAPPTPDELRNMATGFTYEPGSTFKAFTVAGALQQHMVTPSTVFHAADRAPGRRPNDHRRRGPRPGEPHGRPDPRPVVERRRGQDRPRSSGPQHFDDWVRHFGFGEPTGHPVPRRGAGHRPDPVDSTPGSTMGNLPIGQGLSVTPIQMAAAYSAIADGGILRQPQLVLDQGDTPGVRAGRAPGDQLRQDAAKLRQMLEGVLAPGGTASEVSIPGYTLAGKTGTAQEAVNGGYSTPVHRLVRRLRARRRTRGFWSRSSSTTRKGGYLRRHRGRPGVRRDRQVRAALSRDPARPARSLPSAAP